MKVTTKGQVTIPLAVRVKAGITPGSEVAFREEKGRIYLCKIPGTGRGTGLAERMAGQGSIKMTTDDILALTRGGR